MTLDEHISNIKENHRLVSAHHCLCGWQGDNAITHIIDTLGLEEVGLIHQTCIQKECPHFGLAVNYK